MAKDKVFSKSSPFWNLVSLKSLMFPNTWIWGFQWGCINKGGDQALFLPVLIQGVFFREEPFSFKKNPQKTATWIYFQLLLFSLRDLWNTILLLFMFFICPLEQ